MTVRVMSIRSWPGIIAHITSASVGLTQVIQLFNDVLLHPSAANQKDDFYDLTHRLHSALENTRVHATALPLG